MSGRAALLARVAEARQRDPARVGEALRADLAEEISIPLRGMLGLADTIAEETPAAGNEGLIEGVRRIRVSGRLLLPLMAEVLDAGRVAPGKYPDEWEALAARLRYLRTPVAAVACHAGLLAEDRAAMGHERLLDNLLGVRAAVDFALGLADDVAALLELLSGGTPATEPSPTVRETAERFRAAASPAPAPRPSAGSAGSVLVVDDSQVNRDLLHRLLSRLGYRVVLAEGGLHALALVRSQAVDLVLLDIIMPEVDGFQVLHQMKADRHLRTIPVIMISALDEVASVGRCIEMGAEDYLTKPFDPVVLKARVGETLEKQRRSAGVRSA